MKNYLFIISIILLLIPGLVSAQQDPKAKKVLQELSDKTNSYDGIKVSFETSLSNAGESMNEVREGNIITSGDQYHLYFEDMEVISDGKTVWTVLVDAEEVQVSEVPEDGEADDYANPAKIATVWEKGFNYKYEKEDVLNGTKVHVINLYPQDPDKHDFHTIKMYIKKDKMTLAKLVIKGKGGSDVTYNLKSFEFNPTTNKSNFTFNSSLHSNFDVIDLR
ncbi:MAG: outer membrane lipoprotein carrier protein LolA [Vicingaceae bacterium]